LRRDHDREGPWFLNPDCVISSRGELPEEFSWLSPLVSKFAPQGTMAWVRDAASNSVLPFWLGPEIGSAVHELQAHENALSTLTDDVRSLLIRSGILVNAEHKTQRVKDKKWEETVGKAAALFRNNGYAPLPQLIHPFHVAALRRYYRYLIRTGAIQLGDGQSPRRYVAYNEPVARFFHHQIAATLSAIAGVALKPSYVYLASYLSGAGLKKHTDREQCEYSITLCLDFSPEPALATPWPIQLDTLHGSIAVYQALGDGLAYRGTRLPHYRDPLGDGQVSTSIFFHYVAADFTGSLD
jgi:hypothetical protein